MTLYDYCIENNCTELLNQWDSEKNGDLTPKDVAYGSGRKVWWRCKKGHQWQTYIYARCHGRGCPVCAGKMVISGENDLATTNPELAAKWHPTKNGSLTPREVSCGSKKKVWWLCDKGHEWQASVHFRSIGTGCPVCNGKVVIPGENDLASAFPNIAAQWHPTKNDILKPNQVSPYANRKVWWLCDKGHEYYSMVSKRTFNNTGCPVCAGQKVLAGFNDLATVEPKIAAQWHPTLNEGLTPEMVTCGCIKKVWWQCDEGHVWKADINSRAGTNKRGCPYCAGKKVLAGFNDLATVEPKIAVQWHPTLNEGLTPEMVTCGSRKKVWWQCDEGHVWKAVINSRASKNKTGCPVCAGQVNKRP